jgi:hypothetical protein
MKTWCWFGRGGFAALVALSALALGGCQTGAPWLAGLPADRAAGRADESPPPAGQRSCRFG